MKFSDIAITFEESNPEIVEILESKLLSSLYSDLEQSKNYSFTLSINDENDSLIGGLVASTSYSWLLIKILWVDETQRNKGLAKSLMEFAESKGKELQCHSAWLDTSNPKAMQFYLKLGYELFGEIKNNSHQLPVNHQRWFMKKVLGN